MRDWGHASDYVEMQWLMLQQDKPDDFVIATGKQVTVRQFIEISAARVGIEIRWSGHGVDEIGIVKSTVGSHRPGVRVGQIIIRIDPKYFRPTEVDTLLGNPSKAREHLGWKPTTSLDQMIDEMVAHDLEEAKKEVLIKAAF